MLLREETEGRTTIDEKEREEKERKKKEREEKGPMQQVSNGLHLVSTAQRKFFF